MVGNVSKKRLLIIDDEAALLFLLDRFLTRTGFHVHTCPNAHASLDLLRNVTDFDLVLVDLTLPDRDGVELFTEIRGMLPLMPVLLCSGYPFDTDSLPLPLRGRVWFIQKPFSPRSLSQVIDEILDQDSTKSIL